MDTNNKKNRFLPVGGWRHRFAGLLLFLFSMSHFAMLGVADSSQASISTVFPFITNWQLHLITAIFELSIAVACVKYRGSDAANLAILSFLSVMVWYRWALSYTDGLSSCKCLGVLGKALHLDKEQEKIAPTIALILLSLVALPSLFAKVLRWFKAVFANGPAVCRMFVIGGAVTVGYHAYGQNAIEIQGRQKGYHRSSKTGKTNEIREVAFSYTCSGVSWRICATNVAALGSGLKTPWEEIIYDGTNTYTFMPGYRDWHGKTYPVRATISPGPLFLRDYDEFLDIDVIWIMYGLCPTNVATNRLGLVEIPLPWYQAHSSPLCYGSEWKLTPSIDGMFVEECQVVGNTNLNLSKEEEMRRPTVNYPESIAMRNDFSERIDHRYDMVTNGFVQCIYKCTDWIKTNGFCLPKASQENLYLSRLQNKYPILTADVEASQVDFQKISDPLLSGKVEVQTFVTDYRFRRTNADHMLPYLEYVLNPGESWKQSDDPDLVRKAENAFNSPDTRVDFIHSKRRSYFTWLLLVLVLAPLVIMLRPKKNQ